jgi:hypothetical protein
VNDVALTSADRDVLADWLDDPQELIETRITRKRPSEWATEKRVMPNGLTSLPGPFRWETTPYLREIIDCFATSSPIQKVAIMKGAQLGLSVGVLENLIGWIIDVEPGPTLFVTADKELAESVVETRVDRMIESAGIAHKIFAQVEKAHGRKTGDTKSKKEFPGGFLLPVGPNVAGKLRSYSIKTILFDEVDGFPQEVGAEGDPLKLAERRTDAFSRTRKILYIADCGGIKQDQAAVRVRRPVAVLRSVPSLWHHADAGLGSAQVRGRRTRPAGMGIRPLRVRRVRRHLEERRQGLVPEPRRMAGDSLAGRAGLPVVPPVEPVFADRLQAVGVDRAGMAAG